MEVQSNHSRAPVLLAALPVGALSADAATGSITGPVGRGGEAQVHFWEGLGGRDPGSFVGKTADGAACPASALYYGQRRTNRCRFV